MNQMEDDADEMSREYGSVRKKDYENESESTAWEIHCVMGVHLILDVVIKALYKFL
jgi:hypothetical protein